MPKPKECPKCKAVSDEINNAHDMNNMLGLSAKGVKKWMCGKCSYFFNDDEAESETWYDLSNLPKMKLSQVADIIIDDWGSRLNPRALPYVEAMMNLDTINDNYKQDSAESIVEYFLTNAQKWHGPVAQKVKQHLHKLIEKN